MQTRQGMRMQGLRDLIDQLRREKEKQLKQYDLESMMDDLKETLDRIVGMEREELKSRLEEARGSGEGEDSPEEMREMLERMVQKKMDQLDSLPESVGGTFKELMDYEFFDDEAREEFQKLLDMLRQKMLDPYARDLAERMQNMGPGEMDAIKQMLSDLNEMLERQRMGLDPGYDDFRQRYRGAFPDMPDTLEEFIEDLQRRISQMRSLMNSLSDEARESLEQMMQSQMSDPELAELMASLAENLEALHPTRRRMNGYPFEGEEELSWDEAMRLMSKMQDMEELEAQIRRAQASRGLEGIDMEKLREVLGEEAEEDVEALRQLVSEMEEAGYLRFKDGRMELTPKGHRRIGQKALRDIFGHMKKDRRAAHEVRRTGIGVEDVQESKRYEFGDPFRLNIPRMVLNAVERSGVGTPVQMIPDDLEIYKPEHQTRSATVLLLDQSRSMDLSGDFFGAKKVALALHSLISGAVPEGRPSHNRVFADGGGDKGSGPAGSGRQRQCAGHEHASRASAGSGVPGKAQVRKQTDHHDHGRRADGPHGAGLSLFRLAPEHGNGAGHSSGSEALYQGWNNHQRLHAGHELLPDRLHGTRDEDKPGSGVLHDGWTGWASTSWLTTSTTRGRGSGLRGRG